MSAAQKRAVERRQLIEKVKNLTAVRNEMQAEISRLKSEQDNAFRQAEKAATATVKMLIARLEGERDTAVRNAHDYRSQCDRLTGELSDLRAAHKATIEEMARVRESQRHAQAQAFKFRGLAKNAAGLVLKSVIPTLQSMAEDVMEEMREDDLQFKVEKAVAAG